MSRLSSWWWNHFCSLDYRIYYCTRLRHVHMHEDLPYIQKESKAPRPGCQIEKCCPWRHRNASDLPGRHCDFKTSSNIFREPRNTPRGASTGRFIFHYTVSRAVVPTCVFAPSFDICMAPCASNKRFPYTDRRAFALFITLSRLLRPSRDWSSFWDGAACRWGRENRYAE